MEAMICSVTLSERLEDDLILICPSMPYRGDHSTLVPESEPLGVGRPQENAQD